MASSTGTRANTINENDNQLNPVIISSDSEDETQVHQLRPTTWFKDVTKAMASRKKKQVLHFPNPHVSEELDGITRIRIKSLTSRFNYPAYIITANRKKKERFIGEAWYEYLGYHKPKPGDLLIFTLHNPPNNLYVRLVRRQDRY